MVTCSILIVDIVPDLRLLSGSTDSLPTDITLFCLDKICANIAVALLNSTGGEITKRYLSSENKSNIKFPRRICVLCA